MHLRAMRRIELESSKSKRPLPPDSYRDPRERSVNSSPSFGGI